MNSSIADSIDMIKKSYDKTGIVTEKQMSELQAIMSILKTSGFSASGRWMSTVSGLLGTSAK